MINFALWIHHNKITTYRAKLTLQRQRTSYNFFNSKGTQEVGGPRTKHLNHTL